MYIYTYVDNEKLKFNFYFAGKVYVQLPIENKKYT